MIYALIGVVCGIVIGLITGNNFLFSIKYSTYIYLTIIALVNSIFTILAKKNMEEFKIRYCFIYIFVDIIVAIVTGFIGEHLGFPLYLALVFAFGNNVYKNLCLIINSLITKKVV